MNPMVLVGLLFAGSFGTFVMIVIGVEMKQANERFQAGRAADYARMHGPNPPCSAHRPCDPLSFQFTSAQVQEIRHHAEINYANISYEDEMGNSSQQEEIQPVVHVEKVDRKRVKRSKLKPIEVENWPVKKSVPIKYKYS